MNRAETMNRGMENIEALSALDIPSMKGKVSEEEWRIRVDLAAAYRLVAHYGWDDLIFTHLSARVPGPEHHFLLNPYQLMFEEVTASSLVKVDADRPFLIADLAFERGDFDAVERLGLAHSAVDRIDAVHAGCSCRSGCAAANASSLPAFSSARSKVG